MDFNFDTGTISSILNLDPGTSPLTILGNGGLIVPSGTTAQRPANTNAIRYNTDTGLFEGLNNAAWVPFQGSSSNLTGLSNLPGTGILAQTGVGTYSQLTITGTASNIVVTNGNGVAGNPTINLATAGTAGTYVSITTDSFGRVTTGTTTQAWSTLTGTPTTLTGYGITNAVTNAGGVPSLSAGTAATRPTAGTAGRLYIATDTNSLYYDNGTAWALIEPAVTGDVSIGAGGTVATLATVNSNVGTFGSTTTVPVVTVNGKGLVTAVSTATISGAISVTGGDLTLSGNTGTAITNATLATVNSNIGVFGDATHIAQYTVNAKGLITASSNIAIATSYGLSGDGTASGTVGGTVAMTLATVNATTGQFGSSTTVPQFTVNAKGLVTAVSNVAIANGLTFTGDATGSGTVGGATALTLANVVTAGIVGDSSHVGQITVNAKGLVTSAANVAITPAAIGAVATTALGAVNGVATLDASGKLTTSQIPAALVGGMNYQGTWNATTNVPALASGVGTKGYYYKVAVAGTTTVDGLNQWNVGDMIVFDGTTWDKIDGLSSEVTSVFGRVGAVTATLASADFANQGTTVTVLHGNAAGNPTWGAINLATDVTGVLPATSHPALTGDVTTTSGSVATTLTTVNATTGAFGSATQVGTFTVNGKGLVTAAANVTIPNTVALTGDVTATGTTGGAVASTLATVNANVGVYGSTTTVPVVTVNGKGLVTAVTTAAIPNTVALTGDGTASVTTGGSGALTLATVNATTGQFGDATHVAQFTVNGKGLVTAVANVVIPNTVALTGDGTASVTTGGSGALTLATVNANVGTFGTTTAIPVVTVNAKGLVTAMSTVAISGGISVTGGDLTMSGNTGTAITNATLATVNANVGQWGDATHVPQFTVNAKGLVTAVGNIAITAAGSGAVANAGATPSIQAGTLAGRPAAGTTGALYVTTDTNMIFRDNGTAWVEVGESALLHTENAVSPVASTVSGTNALSLGGNNIVSGTNATAIGYGASTAIYGAIVNANGSFATVGDAQTGNYVLRNITNNATQTEVFLDGASARIVLPANSAMTYSAYVVARRTDSTGSYGAWKIEGLVSRDATAASTALVGSRSKTVLTKPTGWDAEVVADTTNGALTFKVTGVAANTVRWVVTVITSECTN